MHPQYKLIRFSNGEQVIGEVTVNDNITKVRNMFLTKSRETPAGYVTGVVKWLTYISEEPIIINTDHITFMTEVDPEIVEYLKKRQQEESEIATLSPDDMEQEYKEAVMERYLMFANTSNIMH